MDIWIKFKMNSPSVVLLLCLKIAELFLSVNCYSASDTISKEFPGTLTKNFPNHFSRNVSAYDKFTYRFMDAPFISAYNSSMTRLEIIASVDTETPPQFPVFVSVIQREERVLMQLPYVYRNAHGETSAIYASASSILCIPKSIDDRQSHILVSVSTGSNQKIPFHLKILVEDKLQLQLNETANFKLNPASQAFVHFPFGKNTSQNVVVRMSSDNDYCMAIAIQEPSCPVFDSKDKFGLGSHWEVMSKKGAVRINMRKYLKGFYVKMILLQDDSLCGRTSDIRQYRQKSVGISVENDLVISTSNGYFWIAVGVPPLVSLFVGIIFGGMYIISYSITRNRMVSCRTQGTNKADNNLVSLQKFSKSDNPGPANYGKWTIFVSLFFAIPIVDQSIYNSLNFRGTGLYGVCSHNDLCSHTLWIFKDFNHLWSNVCYLVLGLLFILVTVMKKCIKQIDDATEGVQFNVGLYYSMGLALIVKGVLSTAYHFCPNKSNFQYDVTYLSVVIAICFLKVFELRRPKSLNVDASCGFLASWLLISSVGIMFERYALEWNEAFWIFRIVAAVIQGLILFYASIYAIYIGYPISKLKVKVIQKEQIPLQHVMLSELRQHQAGARIQPSNDDTEEEDYMKSIYEIPRFLWIFPKLWQWKLPVCRPERWIYVFFMLSLNGLLIYYSLEANYTLYGLVFLLANFGLNFVYYFIMKAFLGEFGCSWKSIQVFLYLLCAITLGAFSAQYFLKNTSEWSKPESLAREDDEDCIWFEPYSFYDKHDAWHMLSAHALFFVFMTLLSIDDGVEGIDRDFLLAF